MRRDEPFYLLTQYAKKSDIRRVWFGHRKNISDSQRVWVRYMLLLWGKVYGGDDYAEGGECSVIGRLMVRSDWNENEGKRIIQVVNDLHKMGYKGDELFKKSHEILNPKSSLSDLIALAKEQDDAAFIESVINKTFKLSNPIRHVAIKRYCDRKYPQKMARELRFGQEVSIQQCTRRIEWALEILEEELYYAIKRAEPEH
ncbi:MULTISPECIES: DUF1133 family protein [unclassified Providencia]|uniref:DUF1133 family protein n=1 Tax=unclassified Providencia TaxID=2633465 RepID=UPI0012B54E99|nr:MULTISPECIES: DUF1133 family protein [unclassified Providencia]MTC24912.1 DUF1133 family protein [Providencia sp. wls1938]